jgi:hypothetical protein
MDAELDELYLEWLYDQVGWRRSPNVTHWNLLKQMLSTEFVWLVPNDDNRMEDGRELRYEFVRAMRFEKVPAAWMGMGCSVLEMMVAVSRVLAFEAEGQPGEWFWHLVDNLKLSRYNDRVLRPGSVRQHNRIAEILEVLVFRQYEYNGEGGLFPLENPHKDQRQVEIWYQLNAYLLERE